jgi:ribonuclease D
MPKQHHKIKPPLFINQKSDFETVIEEIKTETILAVDTEANSLFAYQEQVCLIQLSSPSADYIIDPLSLSDLTPLGELFYDPTIEKVFHASEYDLLILYEDYKFEFQNLFDTMLAAQILGRQKLGLDALLEELVGLKVDKKYQRSNWGRRPLPEDMLLYAQVDTHYLIQVRQLLVDELKAKDLLDIASEDFTRACQVHLQHREDRIAPCWRINGARKLPPQQAAVLASLCEYRENVARELDRPVFKVIGAGTLLQLAEQTPTSKAQLMKLELPGKKNIQRHADGLLDAIKVGLSAKPLYPPKKQRVDDHYLAREQALKNWRKFTARKMDVNSAVILPRDLLYQVISANPQTLAELDDVLKDVPWRRSKFGEEILSVLKRANQPGGAK